MDWTAGAWVYDAFLTIQGAKCPSVAEPDQECVSDTLKRKNKTPVRRVPLTNWSYWLVRKSISSTSPAITWWRAHLRSRILGKTVLRALLMSCVKWDCLTGEHLPAQGQKHQEGRRASAMSVNTLLVLIEEKQKDHEVTSSERHTLRCWAWHTHARNLMWLLPKSSKRF